MRLVIVLTAALLTLAAAYLWRRAAPADEQLVQNVDTSASLAELFAARDRAAPARLPEQDAGVPRYVLTRSDVELFFPSKFTLQFDEQLLTRRPANLDRVVPMAEHPAGQWGLRTNSLGMREDAEPLASKPDLRVIVVGDSHVDGVCDNRDSFAQRLEEDLRTRFPERTVEVLNAAVGGWSFYNYLGALEALEPLEPDVFVVVVYGGNDFAGGLVLHHYHRDEPFLQSRAELRRRVAEIDIKFKGASAQHFGQLSYFATHPSEEAAAAQMAEQLTSSIARRARARGIGLVGVYLPSLVDAELELFPKLAEAAAPFLAQIGETRSVADRLADQWLAGLAAEGAQTLDLRPSFRASAELLYWRSDLHINLGGHALAAAELAEPVLAAAGW